MEWYIKQLLFVIEKRTTLCGDSVFPVVNLTLYLKSSPHVECNCYGNVLSISLIIVPKIGFLLL